MEIPVEQLDHDDGMKTLLDKVDGVFQREEKDHAYEAYSHFDCITKDSSLSMADYIIDLEQRYNQEKFSTHVEQDGGGELPALPNFPETFNKP